MKFSDATRICLLSPVCDPTPEQQAKADFARWGREYVDRTWPTPAQQDEAARLERVQKRTHTTPHEL